MSLPSAYLAIARALDMKPITLLNPHVGAIWRDMDKGGQYNWRLTDRRASALTRLIPQTQISHLRRLQDQAALNHALRACLKRPLVDVKTTKRACDWVVTYWGGIRGDTTALRKRLHPFNLAEIEAFIAETDLARISSWSKLLSFAHPDLFPIYDSRIATALNICLYKQGLPVTFLMPPSRSPKTILAQAKLRQLGDPSPFSYHVYRALVQRAVRRNLAPSTLAAEMFLFANSREVIRDFDPK